MIKKEVCNCLFWTILLLVIAWPIALLYVWDHKCSYQCIECGRIDKHSICLFCLKKEEKRAESFQKLKLKYMVEKGWKEPKAELQAIKDFEETEKISQNEDWKERKNRTIKRLKLEYMLEKDWKESKAELQAIKDYDNIQKRIEMEKKRLQKEKQKKLELERIKNYLICDYCKEKDKTVEKNTDTISGYDLLMCRSCKEERNE